jgi:hypothetical protein
MKDLLNVMRSLIFPLVFSGCSLPRILGSTFGNVKGRVQECLRGWTGPSTFQKVLFSNSFLYLSHFLLVLLVFIFICKRKQKEKSGWSYVGGGSENRPLQIFDPFLRPTGLGSTSQMGRDLLSDPSPIQDSNDSQFQFHH